MTMLWLIVTLFVGLSIYDNVNDTHYGDDNDQNDDENEFQVCLVSWILSIVLTSPLLAIANYHVSHHMNDFYGDDDDCSDNDDDGDDFLWTFMAF